MKGFLTLERPRRMDQPGLQQFLIVDDAIDGTVCLASVGLQA
jgi:hypothetical protein